MVWNRYTASFLRPPQKINYQRHEPLSFLSGSFNSMHLGPFWKNIHTPLSLHWTVSTLLQNSRAVLTSTSTKYPHVSVLLVVPDLSQTSFRKVLLWAASLIIYYNVSFLVLREDNEGSTRFVAVPTRVRDVVSYRYPYYLLRMLQILNGQLPTVSLQYRRNQVTIFLLLSLNVMVFGAHSLVRYGSLITHPNCGFTSVLFHTQYFPLIVEASLQNHLYHYPIYGSLFRLTSIIRPIFHPCMY